MPRHAFLSLPGIRCASTCFPFSTWDPVCLDMLSFLYLESARTPFSCTFASKFHGISPVPSRLDYFSIPSGLLFLILQLKKALDRKKRSMPSRPSSDYTPSRLDLHGMRNEPFHAFPFTTFQLILQLKKALDRKKRFMPSRPSADYTPSRLDLHGMRNGHFHAFPFTTFQCLPQGNIFTR